MKDLNTKVDREVSVLKKTWYRTKKKHLMIAASNIHSVDPNYETRRYEDNLPLIFDSNRA
jgi:hypothetical protein